MPPRLLALLSAVLLLLPAAPAWSDAAVRPNGIILNETVSLAPGGTSALPLYLTRRGEYYAQAILEAGPDGRRRDVALDLTLSVVRNEEVIYERSVRTSLGSEQPVGTLFWVTSDRELPIKTPLTLSLSVDAVNPAAANETIRIQVKRKPNPGFRGVW